MCAIVAERACSVRLQPDSIAPYAHALPLDTAPPEQPPTRLPDREQRAAFWFQLDAINFGSGWFPTLSKRDGLSGYGTIAGGERAAEITPESLTGLPHDLVHTMREAVISADLDQLLAMIQEVEARDPRMAQELRRLAERFEYQKLLDLFGPGEPSESALCLAGSFPCS